MCIKATLDVNGSLSLYMIINAYFIYEEHTEFTHITENKHLYKYVVISINIKTVFGCFLVSGVYMLMTSAVRYNRKCIFLGEVIWSKQTDPIIIFPM